MELEKSYIAEVKPFALNEAAYSENHGNDQREVGIIRHTRFFFLTLRNLIQKLTVKVTQKQS